MDNREEVQEPEQVGLRIDVEESGALVRYFDCTTAQTAADADGYAPNALIDIGGDGQIKIVAIAAPKIETSSRSPSSSQERFARDSLTLKPPDYILRPTPPVVSSVPRAPLPMERRLGSGHMAGGASQLLRF